jgi:hypothetical protein
MTEWTHVKVRGRGDDQNRPALKAPLLCAPVEFRRVVLVEYTSPVAVSFPGSLHFPVLPSRSVQNYTASSFFFLRLITRRLQRRARMQEGKDVSVRCVPFTSSLRALRSFSRQQQRRRASGRADGVAGSPETQKAWRMDKL